MKTVIAAAVAIAAAAAPASARTAKTCPAATQAQVEAQFQRFQDAWATGNPDTVAALFAPDATLLATLSNAERTTTPAIRDYFVSFLKAKPVGVVETSTVAIDCTTATRSGNWKVTLNNAKGERTDVAARYSFTYAWDGKNWKIKHLHSSVRPAPNV